MQYLYAFIGIAIGALLMIKTEWLIQNFGRSAWAEEKLGTSGGTRLMYKLIGVAIILLSFLLMTGELGNIAFAILGPLFGF